MATNLAIDPELLDDSLDYKVSGRGRDAAG
jgi:hypothetical protein